MASSTSLLGMKVDENLSWVQHTQELRKSFANKLSLLKRSRFLPKEVLEDFYFKIILPSVNYGLVLWGSCCNTELIHSIESTVELLELSIICPKIWLLPKY